MTEEILLTCPKCSNVLDRLAASGVEVDRCSECGGIWLDQGELVKLKLGAGGLELLELQRQAPGDRRVPPSSAMVKLPCPACSGEMAAFPVEGMLIDICEECRGLWLDKGEFELALKALDSQLEPEVMDALVGMLVDKREA